MIQNIFIFSGTSPTLIANELLEGATIRSIEAKKVLIAIILKDEREATQTDIMYKASQ